MMPENCRSYTVGNASHCMVGSMKAIKSGINGKHLSWTPNVWFKQRGPEPTDPTSVLLMANGAMTAAPFFASNNLKVALWNIDSQDWNAKISNSEAAQRVLTLMLLWRRGVILFHDVHEKSAVAVPWIIEQTRSSGIVWDDCHKY